MNEGTDAYSTQQRRISEMGDAAKVKAEWQGIESIIADLTDEDLTELKALAIQKNPEMAKLLNPRDPRKSKLLMAEIVKVIHVQ